MERFKLTEVSQFAIRRWRLLLVACVGLLLLAYMSWSGLPKTEDPRVEPSFATVVIPYPGASPADVEAQVIKRVEETLYAMEGVEWIESLALPNQALFNVKFEEGTPMAITFEKIRGKVQGIKKDLPSDVKDAELIRYSTDLTPQVVIAVAGNRSDAVLSATARRIKDALGMVRGVVAVELWGEATRAVRVQIDADALARHGLTVEQVVQQLKLANVRVPAGELRVGSLVTLLQANQQLHDRKSLAELPLAAAAGDDGARTLRLGDVAQIREDGRAPRRRFMYAGQPAVGLELRYRPGDNAMTVHHAVRARLAELQRDLPAGVSLAVAHDAEEWTSTALSSFFVSLGEGIALVLVIITLGMGWRAAVVVAGVLPLSVAGAVCGLFGFGFGIDNITLAGLIIALGLLVDDAIVVSESIQLLRDRGMPSLHAAIAGAARVFWANNGTTAVACAAFLPLFFMSGIIGAFIRGLPTAVILALVTSLLVSQFFTPWISIYVLRPHRLAAHHAANAEEANPVLRGLRALYVRFIPWVLANPVKIISACVVLLIGSLALLPLIGVQFFPKADKPALFVTVAMPRGTHLDRTAEKVAEAVAIIEQDPTVLDTSAVVGEGYPHIFYGARISHRASSDFGDILVHPRAGEPSSKLAARLRQSLSAIIGANINVEELYTGPQVPHPVNIRLYGDDYLRLREYAEAVKDKVRAVPGAINVSDTLTDSVPLTQVRFDVERAARVGVTPGQAGATLRWLYGDDKISQYRDGPDDVEVLVDGRDFGRAALPAVRQTPIPSLAGARVPLREFADVQLDHGFAELKRRNGRRIVEVTADVEGKTLPADVVKAVAPWLQAQAWPAGYGYDLAGAQEETQKSFRKLGIAAVGAMLIIFLLLVLLFDSFVLAVVILAAVPFGVGGAVLGLAITGNPFGFMAFLGLIALISVYVNHKIYFVDRMRQLMAQGQDLGGAIRQAGRDRMRPVVLTALTAVLGLFPLALSGTLWSAFAWANIFGLLASIPLSLVLLPALIAVAFRFRRVPRDAARAPAESESPPSQPSEPSESRVLDGVLSLHDGFSPVSSRPNEGSAKC
jgi:multidrug efflux pump subunit AcrB